MSIDTVRSMIHWLGHDGYRIDAGKTIYIDPFELKDGGPGADLILVTHEHYDHCSARDIKKIRTDQTLVITEKLSAKKIKGNVRTVSPGDTVTVDGVTVTAVPAYNTDKTFHPKSKGWLGFVLEIDGVRIYHAGDTDLIPEMSSIQADIALLPVSGTYVMTALEAVEAARTLKPSLAIPMHYDSLVGTVDDARLFAENLKGSVEVAILEKE